MVDSQINNMRHVRRVHFVGIGGAGMSGIAEVLLNQGYHVSGSDIALTDVTTRLANMGAKIYNYHSGDHVNDNDVVVVSSAVDSNNPEVSQAHDLRLPVISRAEMLGELMRFRYGIAIAGTHGKTTTTSFITGIFEAEELDPTFVIGGILNSSGTNARLGSGKYLIAEADESDASFLELEPMSAVITNIDADHLGSYNQNFNELCHAFLSFLKKLPFYGVAVLCIDDPNVKALLPEISRPTVTYGFDRTADFRITDLTTEGDRWGFSVQRPNGLVAISVTLSLPGRHNVLNAAAAIAIATEENISDSSIIKGLTEFSGVGRRFEIHRGAKVGATSITLVDDYGHHPTEIKCVIQTARSVWPENRIFMIYQPHRYSRTRELYDDFVSVLSEVDELLLLEVYPAGESPLNGCDGTTLCRDIDRVGQLQPTFVSNPQNAFSKISELVQENDILIVQGAGNVNLISKTILSTSGDASE